MTTLQSDDGSIMVYGHTKVVYTWPLLLLGYLFMILHLIGLGGPWMTWAYVISIFLTILTLTLDLNRNASLLLSALAFLLFIIWALIKYAFGVDLVFGPLGALGQFDSPYAPAPFAFLSLLLSFLWVVDFIDSYFNKRFKFKNGEMYRLVLGMKDSESRAEQVRIDAVTPDWLEKLLWGGHIYVFDRDSNTNYEILNVWNHSKVARAISAEAPGDRSDSN